MDPGRTDGRRYVKYTKRPSSDLEATWFDRIAMPRFWCMDLKRNIIL